MLIPSLPRVIQVLKGLSAREINHLRGTIGQPVWQERYHERVIRSERELEKFRQYIESNPLRVEIARSHGQTPG